MSSASLKPSVVISDPGGRNRREACGVLFLQGFVRTMVHFESPVPFVEGNGIRGAGRRCTARMAPTSGHSGSIGIPNTPSRKE